MSFAAFIPWDLRERLGEQIKVLDRLIEHAVAAERERCVRIADDYAARATSAQPSAQEAALAAEHIAAAIRKGE